MALRNGYSINAAPAEESEGAGDKEPLIEIEAVPPQCCSARYTLAVLMFFGFSVVYGLRVNLSVAMVAMVNTTDASPTANHSLVTACPLPRPDNSSVPVVLIDTGPQYPWDAKTQGWLLGAFFFGYLFTQIPGGYLSGHYGGSLFLGGGVLGTAALTLLTPLAAQGGAEALFALRALEGFGEGVTFPAMMAMWARWAPPLERSTLISLSASGASFGAFVALPLTALICQTLGWPAVFYICGSGGCLWAVFWFFLVSDDPRTHRRISEEEKNYIINSIGPQGSPHGWSVPLLSMALSGPLWAIILTQMCANWSYYTMLTSMPTYMNNVLHFDLSSNAALSAVPFLGALFVSVLSGFLADRLIEKRTLSTTAVRKLLTLIGLLVPAVCLVAAGYAGCCAVPAVALLCVSATVGGISAAGVFINQIDIAPRYAGVLLGITNTFGTIPGVLAPIVTGYLTEDHTLTGWRNVFWVSAGVNALGALIFTCMGSGVIQTWALTEEERAEEERAKKERGEEEVRRNEGDPTIAT
ncbi:LOW QUALITY PROTEIN: sialin [Gadus morhua]|uniref:LOW QUALITY PROTEIN: sialin n=1 Tax=Gadus morhua TaxID=8049 RepID=UPI003F49E35B